MVQAYKARAIAALALTGVMVACSGSSKPAADSTIKVTDFNVHYDYHGPERDPKTKALCNQPSSRHVFGASDETVKDGIIYFRPPQIGTNNGCDLTVTEVAVGNKELKVTSVVPELPVRIEKGGSRVQLYVTLERKDPTKSFKGPVSMEIRDE